MGEGKPEIEWDDVSKPVLDAIAERLGPLVKRAADDLYERLLYDVQDNLTDNATFNIGSRIASADRQALHDRKALAAEIARTGSMFVLLSQLKLDGMPDQARLVVMAQNPADNHHWSKAVGEFTVREVREATEKGPR